MKMKLPPDSDPEQPNMTPFIDVVFQLLIFFMLTLHFKQIEGQIISQLPKDKGMSPSESPSVEEKEVRIVFCADGNVREHLENKGKHEGRMGDVDYPLRPKSAQQVHLVVEGEFIAVLKRSVDDPDKDDPKSNAIFIANAGHYKRAAARASEIFGSTPSSLDPTKKAPIKIDADSEVPYEHIIGVLNELKRNKIDNVEYVANPRLSYLYGAQLKANQ